MQRSRNAVINWLSRVTTPRCGRKKCACERASGRASERASHEPDPAASAAILDQAILTSALHETARCFLRLSFARGVIYRPYFPSQAPGHRAPNESFVSFYCSLVRIARFRIISAITVVSVLQKLDTLLAQPMAVRANYALNRVVPWINYKYRSFIYRKKFQIITYLKAKKIKTFFGL